MNFVKKYNRNRWNLAFFTQEDLKSVLAKDFSQVRWMKYDYRDRWFADPFILSVNDSKIVVLVEELTYSTNKGRLARLEVDKETYELTDMQIILDLPTHLSFPMIFRLNNETLLLPENSASGRSIIYKYNDDKRALERMSIICEDTLTDATMCEIGDELFLFSTKMPTQNGNVLYIYRINKENFTATLHQCVEFESNIARNAGLTFFYQGALYRPAQDCNGDYGKGVILQCVHYDEIKKEFYFTNDGAIYPFSFEYQKGLHTLNSYNGLYVIDARGFLYPRIGRLVRPLFNVVHKILGI